jgi:hypothetical protein
MSFDSNRFLSAVQIGFSDPPYFQEGSELNISQLPLEDYELVGAASQRCKNSLIRKPRRTSMLYIYIELLLGSTLLSAWRATVNEPTVD